jgi:hypothetical protein
MTVVWSPLPTTPATAAGTLAAWHAASAARFADLQPLPWALEDLAGSTWRQVHTGWLAEAHPERDEAGLPVLAWSAALYRGDSMGCWHKTPCDPWPAVEHAGRYVVERWVRVDLLRPELRLTWCRVELEGIDRELAENNQRLCNTRLRRLLTERNDRLLQRRAQLIAEGQALARAHHIAFDLAAGAVEGAGVQLLLV